MLHVYIKTTDSLKCMITYLPSTKPITENLPHIRKYYHAILHTLAPNIHCSVTID